MGKVYDDWGRLVEAVIRREKLRQLCYVHSATSSDCSSVLDHDSLQLHAAKTTMVRLQEEVIRILTLNKQFFEDGYMSPPTWESRQCTSFDVEECVVELLDPDMIPRIEAMFRELGSVIRVHPPPIPSPDGGIHPLMRHAVGYVLCFEEYDQTFNWILEDMFGGGLDAGVEQSMLAAHLHSITSCLEGNIASISGLYDDTSLQHVFMMNNIQYMVEKIGKSRMRTYFGDEWIERGFEKYQSHALGYKRSLWSSFISLLHLLKVDWATIKTRCRELTEAFEKACDDQTGLFVPNLELLHELRISALAIRDKYPYKNMQDQQRYSIESSGPSFSSSFSYLSCNKATQLEAGSIDIMVFPETPSTSMQSTSLEFGLKSLDLRSGSIYRETQGLSVKSRPPLGKKRSTPADTKESIRILAKLQEAHRYNYEPRAFLRSSSYHYIEGLLLSISKDAPPLFYDGREGSNSAAKLKDPMRLPLDNEECLGADSNSNFLSFILISTKEKMDEIDVPQYFLCPISLQIMKDPVTTVTGITYDRENIEQWLSTAAENAAVCPVTKLPLSTASGLTPNHKLRRLIQGWCIANATSGIDRIPTPKETLHRAAVLKHIRGVGSRRSAAENLEALRKMEELASDGEKNQQCMAEAGAARSMLTYVMRCSGDGNTAGVDRAMRILRLTWSL